MKKQSPLSTALHTIQHRLNLPHKSSTIQQSRGQRGEDLATGYLKKNTTYQLLLRNWSNGSQEIDIICRDEQVLVFVEVRARAAHALVSGYHSITRKKKQSLRKAAYSYMRTLSKRPHTYRYDVIELAMEGEQPTHIHHYKNVRIF